MNEVLHTLPSSFFILLCIAPHCSALLRSEHVLVMEYMSGGDLFSFIKKRRDDGLPEFPEEVGVRLSGLPSGSAPSFAPSSCAYCSGHETSSTND